VVQPVISEWGDKPIEGGEPVPGDFVYRSDVNDQWLDGPALQTMIDSSK
jgi:hypothetical protein